MEALKDAIITATAASSTSDAEKPNMEKLRELIKDFFQSPEGRIIVNEAIEKFMSSPDGVSLVESAIVAAMARHGAVIPDTSRLSASRHCLRR